MILPQYFEQSRAGIGVVGHVASSDIGDRHLYGDAVSGVNRRASDVYRDRQLARFGGRTIARNGSGNEGCGGEKTERKLMHGVWLQKAGC